MGKIRHVIIGDEMAEEEQRRKADARREAKKMRKHAEEEDEALEASMTLEEAEKASPKKEKAEKAAKIKEKREKKETEKPEEEAPTTRPKSRSKKYQEMARMVDAKKSYLLADAIGLVKKTSMTSFDGTVELHLNLNPQSLGEKKDLRGSASLPHGTGKKVNVAVADDALIAKIEGGTIDFDILVAHPSMMPKLAKVARILGPKGLMPNPKTGTVTPDIEKRVKELSSGQVNWKTEPGNPIVHIAVGKVSFTDAAITENINAVVAAVGKNKIAKATLTATMGPGVRLTL